MPDLRIPIRSGVHRVAAIALYRALLTQCRAVPLEKVQQDELQNIVRNRFKQARHLRSVARLRVSFEAGYEAIDHLDAAVAGNGESRQYVVDLLERAPAKVRSPPPPSQPGKIKEKSINTIESDEEAKQPRVSILDRPHPLEKLAGRRHIPVLFNANHIPVLRIKKPQPESLSRFLRQRIEQRQDRHDRRWRLYSERELAAREDEWDGLIDAPGLDNQSQTLSEAIGRPVIESVEPKWTAAVRQAIVDVQRKLDEEKVKNRVMAEKMQAVVDRETELAEIEKADRKRIKRREYQQRKKERLLNDGPHSAQGSNSDGSENVSSNG